MRCRPLSVPRVPDNLQGTCLMDIRQLQVFMAVWETGSFSKAALRIHLTQPTVSGHIRSLEDTLGTRLFDRSGGAVAPTRAGRLLYPYARQILRLRDQASRELSLFLGKERGTLEVGGSNIPGQYILPRLAGDFKRGHPGTRLVLRVGDTASVISDVASGDLELGMVGAVLERKDLRFEACFHDELVLVVPPGSPLAGRDGVSLEELRGEPFIMREKGSGTRYATESALERAGGPGAFCRLKVVAEMGSTEAVRQAAKAGLGCAIVSRRAIEDDLRHGMLFSPRLHGVDLTRQFYLLWHEKRTLSPLAAAFRDLVLAQEGPGRAGYSLEGTA